MSMASSDDASTGIASATSSEGELLASSPSSATGEDSVRSSTDASPIVEVLSVSTSFTGDAMTEAGGLSVSTPTPERPASPNKGEVALSVSTSSPTGESKSISSSTSLPRETGEMEQGGSMELSKYLGSILKER
jgi:hypothetical protein